MEKGFRDPKFSNAQRSVQSDAIIERMIVSTEFITFRTQTKGSSDIDSLVNFPFIVSIKDGEFYASMITDIMRKWELTPEVNNWFRVYREKLTDYFKKISNYHDSFTTLILPNLFISDLCNDDLILYTLTHVLIGVEKKSSRMIFLNTIKNKVKSIIYARKNLKLALELKTISSEIIEVFDMIKMECQGPLDKFQDYLLDAISSYDYSLLKGLDINEVLKNVIPILIITYDNIPSMALKISPLIDGNVEVLPYKNHNLIEKLATDALYAHLSRKLGRRIVLLDSTLSKIEKDKKETEIIFLQALKILGGEIPPHEFKYYVLHAKKLRHQNLVNDFVAKDSQNHEEPEICDEKRTECMKHLTEFETFMDQGCRNEAMAVLNQAYFDKNIFHQVMIDKIGSSMNEKGLKFLKEIQECQKIFEKDFKDFTKDEIEKGLKNNNWEKVEKFSKVVAFLYANEFFKFEVLNQIIRGSLRRAKNGSGSLLQIMITCSEKLRREQPAAYLDLLNFTYDYSNAMPQNDGNKKLCKEILENFHKTFPTAQNAGNPDPILKLFILSLTQNDLGFEPHHFEYREYAFKHFQEDAKFFACYAPETRKNPNGIQSTFEVLVQAHVKSPQFIHQLAENFLNFVKLIRSYPLESALNKLHYIALIMNRNILSRSASKEIIDILKNNEDTSKSEFTKRCFNEFITTMVKQLSKEETNLMRNNIQSEGNSRGLQDFEKWRGQDEK